jgi:hypothetical protein
MRVRCERGSRLTSRVQVRTALEKRLYTRDLDGLTIASPRKRGSMPLLISRRRTTARGGAATGTPNLPVFASGPGIEAIKKFISGATTR